MSRISANVIYICGHWVDFKGRESCFWILPFGKGVEGFDSCFHMCYSSIHKRQTECPTCELRSVFRNENQELSDAEIDDLTLATKDAQEVGRFATDLLADGIDHVQTFSDVILEHIGFQLEQNLSVAAKRELFTAILELPSIFDRAAMIEFFGSHYGEFKHHMEKSALIDAAREAGLPGCLSRGLRKSPIPVPCNPESEEAEPADKFVPAPVLPALNNWSKLFK
ncbi:hypothetical protein F5Y18DRAFT_427622 [Xylariaceae sp. FL1019]|nr:hypothetical protein F5Y18DRAFT_427622 [Xylariaceae sp. FL1019]